MKRIIHIARNELYSLFYSPIAWLVMILFLILTSVDYIQDAQMYIESFQKGIPAGNLTLQMTALQPWSFLIDVVKNLYLFYPFLTMGLLSREKNSGTIRLLQSSPIRVREIVLGKFMAITSFTLCLLTLICFLFLAMCIGMIHPDYGQLLGSLFGLFILLSAYAAIGLFVSSLTTYQVVAAIITFAILFLLSQAGDLWQDVEVIRNITFYLNMPVKSVKLYRGLLNLRDVCYFLVLITTFLAFTMIRMRSAMEYISRWKKFSRYVIVVAMAFIVGYVTSSPYINRYWDTTRNDALTISRYSQDLLAKLKDGDLEVTAFSNLFVRYDEWNRASQNLIMDDIWEPFIRFKPNIKLKFVYYYNLDTSDYHFKTYKGKSLREIADLEAASYRTTLDRFLTPEQVSPLVNVAKEENRGFFQLRYKGRTAIVRTFNDRGYWPDEPQIAAALNELLVPSAKVAFLNDEIERGPFSERIRDYKKMFHDLGYREGLVNRGFVCDTLSLKQKDIPDSLSALIIADPRTPIASASLDKIRKYIDAGGNLYLLTEPDRKDIYKPLFDMLGLSAREGMLIQPNDKFSSNTAFPALTYSGKHIATQMAQAVESYYGAFKDSTARIAMTGAGALDYIEKDGFHVTPLIRTAPDLCWNRVTPISNDSLQLKVKPLPSDEQGSFITGLSMTRTLHGKEQRIIVTSDADWMTMLSFFGFDPYRYNKDFTAWGAGYFTYGEFPANIVGIPSLDTGWTYTVDSIPPQKIIFYWVIPGLLAAIASILLIRRKRK